MRRFSCLLLVGLGAAALCACSAPAVEDSTLEALNDPKGNPPELSQSEALCDVMDGTPFQITTPCQVTVYGSGNDQGFYQVLDNQDGSKNLTYIDYNTQEQIYLCAEPNCAHDSDRCASWIEPGSTQVWPAVVGDQLAIVYGNAGANSKIEICNLDGSNRRTLCTFEGGETPAPGAAYRDGFMVLLVNGTYRTENGAVLAATLQAVDLNTGEREILYRNDSSMEGGTEGQSAAFFQGVTDTGFVVKTITVGSSPEIQTQKVWLIPFDGSERKALYEYQTEEADGIPHGNGWYFVHDKGAGQYDLECIDVQTGEIKVIAANLQQTISVETPRDLFIRSFVGDWAILNALTAMELKENGDIELRYQCFAVDLSNGELQELILSNYYYATQIPAEIYAAFGDRLLILADVQEIPGEPGSIPKLEKTLGIIESRDYLQSVRQYQPIQPHLDR